MDTKTGLGPQSLLQRADDLVVEVGLHGEVSVRVGTVEVSAGSRGLAVLDAFAAPTTMQDVVSKLGVRGGQDWIDLTGAIARLARAGALVDPGADSIQRGSLGFGSARAHISMLNDRTRTQAYLDAITAMVKSDDVVVEIGTGTGVLAVAAARAGARKVYAIEQNARIAQVAESVFRDNGVADRVELIHGRSTEIDLPERGTLLLSETLGNRVLDEDMLLTFADAEARLLTKGARRIPTAVSIVAVPLQVPEEHVASVRSTADLHGRWHDYYGVDLSALGSLIPNPGRPFVSRRPRWMRDWPQLASGVRLATITTDGSAQRAIEVTVPASITHAGVLNGVAIVFEAALTANPAAAHVAQVEDAGVLTDALSLLEDALVLDRHEEAREVD